MPLNIQDQYKKELSGLDQKNQPDFQVYIGNLDYLVACLNDRSLNSFFILIHEQSQILPEKLGRLKSKLPFRIFNNPNKEAIQKSISDLIFKVENKNKVETVKIEIQKKRKELEALNEKLNQESEKQVQSLELSHIEESQKNIKEKSLLHFLDFIQSESVHEDFLNLLLRFLWKDLKKIGRIHQVGFNFRAFSEKSTLYTYDGFNQQTLNLSLDMNSPAQLVSTQMASHLGRPVGKILSWSLPEFSRLGFFFIEIFDHNVPVNRVENYIKERLVVLSLYLDRWMIEKEYELIVSRWMRMFKSFSGFVHVIDDEFNIYQSNYLPGGPHLKAQKCYEVLAKKNSKCFACPVGQAKNREFVLREGLRVKTYSSEFKYDSKKYFFVIYEDVTQLHLLKGQMIHSEKMSALGRLGNHLAHELNNPLTGIKSYVQALLQDSKMNLTNTLQSDLNEILKATQRSQHIIKNFIQFSHKTEPNLEKVIFADVLQNALTFLKTVLRPHRLFIDVKSTQVLANTHDLQQVLFNLIKNACQAMSAAGSIKIYEEEKNEKVYFHIEDSGPGFSEEILQNIFEPFRTTKKQGDGTGLGLYLSKKLMNNMNADIQVSQSVSNGPTRGAKISLIFAKL